MIKESPRDKSLGEFTFYRSTDAITSLSLEVDDPNKRVCSCHLNALYSLSDVDSLLSRFNHENNYDDGTTKLHIGDTIYIPDGTYNVGWRIVGFDTDHNALTDDNTMYDNGYGIMLYPYWNGDRPNMCGYWNSNNTVSGGYLNSLAHYNTNQIAMNLKNSIFGSHLVNRNVLLSSSVDSNGYSNGFTWTRAHGVLPSIVNFRFQYYYLGSGFAFDDGEANYKLPLFNYQDYYVGYDFWLRNIRCKINSGYNAYYISSNSYNFNDCQVNYTAKYYHPLIYIR